MAGTNCLTKKCRVPFFNTDLKDKIVAKYMDRPQRCNALTLVQYTGVITHTICSKFNYIFLTSTITHNVHKI